MKIYKLDISTTEIYAEVQGSTDRYIILIDRDGFSCTCFDNSLRHMRNYQYQCKHIKELLKHIISDEYLLKDLKHVLNVDVRMTFLKTGLKCIDELFGGIPHKILFGLVGVPESGKSTLLMQLLFHVLFISSKAKNGGKQKGVVIIDGEGGMYDFVVNYWLEVFNQKYGTDFGVDLWQMNYGNWERGSKKPVMKNIVKSDKQFKFHVIDLVESEDGIDPLFKLCLLVGKPKMIETSSKGKEDLKSHPKQDNFRNIRDTFLGKFLEEHNIQALGLDSLTMVIESQLGSGTESFPSRAKVNMQICHNLQRLVSVFGIYGIVNHHLTRNPQQGIWAVPVMTGGKGTRHNFKFQAGLDMYGGQKPHPSKRWMIVLRSQHAPRGAKKMLFEITSNGIVDLINEKGGK